MSSNKPEDVASVLVKTKGMYLGVFDRQSPANVTGKFEELVEQAGRFAGDERWALIPHLNGLLAELAKSGVLLPWVLLFDGVFRVRLEVVTGDRPPSGLPQSAGRFVAGVGAEAVLSCPSGEIIVDSLLRLGESSLQPVIAVAPGLYRVALDEDQEEQMKHELLDDLTSYPPGDGPDWTLFMRRA